MAYESNTNGLGVTQQYGVRDTGKSLGTEPRVNNEVIFGAKIHAAEMGNGDFNPPVFIPAGFLMTEAYLTISEDGAGYAGPVNINLTAEDGSSQLIYAIPAADLNVTAPRTTNIFAAITGGAGDILKAGTLNPNQRITVDYTGAAPTSGKAEFTMKGQARVITGIGPVGMPPSFSGL